MTGPWVPGVAVDVVDEVLFALVGFSVGGALDQIDLTPTEGQELVRQATHARLLGPLLLAVDLGELVLPDELVEHAAEEHWRALRWCMRLESRYLELREAFDRAGGVDHLVVKGPAIAHIDEASPSLRTFSDIDLLISGDDIDAAVRVLELAGATRPWPQRRPGFDRRFAKSVTLRFSDAVEVDIHRTVCDGVHGFRIPTAELFAERDRFALGGVEVETLSASHRGLHAAYHAVLGSPAPSPMNLRDLADYLARPDLAAPMRVTAERWRGTEVLAEAVAMTLGVVRGEVGGWDGWRAWIEGRSPSLAEVAVIERQRVEGSSFGRARLAAARELPSWRDRAAFAFALTWPTREHLRARGGTRTDQARQLVRRFRGERST